jgi:AcrR family transcriptional regulator
MNPRRYRSAVRDDAVAETVRRIVTATVSLHAEKGAVATTHTDIALRAGVAVPTVYKHFATRADVLPACMGEVARTAPRVDEQAILEEPDFDRRLILLVDAVYGRHAHYAPWQRWNVVDAPKLPDLAAAVEASEQRLENLIHGVLAPAFNGKVPRPPLAVAKVLLGFSSWQELTRILRDANAVKRTATGALRVLFSHLNEKK